MGRKYPRDHYLPAAFIGRFAATPESQARESLVWARSRGIGAAFQEKAANLGFVRGLYGCAGSADPLGGPSQIAIDAAWQKVETKLPSAIATLAAARDEVDARLFGEVLVPFVAGLFVRGWEFNQRYTARMDRLFGSSPELHGRFSSTGSINNARLIELQRLFSPVMRARWTVLTNPTDIPLITNDLGAVPWMTWSSPGIVVPLDPHHAVLLEPRPDVPRIGFGLDSWVVDVEAMEISRTAVVRSNRMCSRVAPRQIYGPTEASVISQHVEMRQRKPVDLPEGAWGAGGRHLARTDLELFDFLIATAQPPQETPRISREQAVELIAWPLPIIFMGTNKESMFSDDEDTRLRMDEMTGRKAEIDRLKARFGPMEILPAPRSTA